jgi:DNA-binding transcriptional LysR family regulator
VSKSIADTEHTVGVRLLDRTSRGAEATHYGRVLLRRGLGAFDELRQGIKDIELLTDPTAGEVRVGCPEAISAGLLSAVIDRFSRQFPQAIVSVTAADNMSREFGQLRDRRVDFLLGRIAMPFPENDLDAEVLYHDQMLLVSSRKSHWGRRRKIELVELVSAPWLLSPAMYGPILAEVFQASGLVAPKVSVASFSTHQTINLLATDRFVSALSGSQLRFNADRFSLKLLPIDLTTQSWPVAIVTLKNRTVSPIVQTFIECVREVAKLMAKGK